MSCGVGHRCSSDPMMLWLWNRAVIRPLAWEPLYATDAALEKTKRQKKNSEINFGVKLIFQMTN